MPRPHALGGFAKRLSKRVLLAFGYELRHVGTLEQSSPDWVEQTPLFRFSERMANRTYRPPKLGGPMPRGGDARVKYLLYFLDFRGLRVLELGPREGRNTIMLEKMGAAAIVSIEGRRENYEQCLRTKDRYGLDNTTFHLGDIEEIAAGRQQPPFTGRFDIVFCTGLLYHLTEPGQTIDWCRGLADELFLQTHYVEERAPERFWPASFRDGTYTHRGQTYAVKLFREDLGNLRSGLRHWSVWLNERDLVTLLRRRGFEQISVLGKDVHAGLPHITILAAAH